MTAASNPPAGRTLDKIRAEISNTATARRLAEDHGRDDIAAFLRTATDLSLDDLNARKNT